MTRVLFYYDIVSPWSHFAHVVIRRYTALWNFDLVLKPIFLGGVMAGSGNKPPITVPNKGAHMSQVDLPLYSRWAGIPYKFPPTFPINTIAIQRFLRVVEAERPDKLDSATTLFFGAFWGPNADAQKTAKAESFAAILESIFTPEEVADLIVKSGSAVNKDRLKDDASKLVAEGAFGAPWFVVENDKGEKANFFGSDRFEVMAFFIGQKWLGPNPVPAARM